MGRRRAAGGARPAPSGYAGTHRSKRRGALLPFGILTGSVLILIFLFGARDPPVPSGVTTRSAALAAPSAVAPAVASPVAAVPAPALVSAALVSPARAESPAPLARIDGKTQYIAGHKVPLRAEPQAKGAILDRYGIGQPVEVLGRSGGWTHVRHTLTRREGWIPAKRLRDAPPVEAEAGAEARTAKPAPALDASAIAKLLIARSIADYPGPCACPYQSARNGSSCGRRAAYVRPGGYAPLCYAKDVTPEMIAAYRTAR